MKPAVNTRDRDAAYQSVENILTTLRPSVSDLALTIVEKVWTKLQVDFLLVEMQTLIIGKKQTGVCNLEEVQISWLFYLIFLLAALKTAHVHLLRLFMCFLLLYLCTIFFL